MTALLLTYAKSLGNEFVIWDDDTLVYRNPLTQSVSLSNFWGAFTSYDPELYVPLTIVSFMLEHALFGYAPFFYHLDGLLLHAVNSFLVLVLLRTLGLRHSTALVLALVFALHPINTEAVAWVSARKDLLSAACILGSMLCFLRSLETPSRRWMVWTGVLLLLALLSKPVAVVTPAVLVLLAWRKLDRAPRRYLRQLLPLIALSAVFLVIGLAGKQRNIVSLSAVETLLLAAKSTVVGVQQFLWPSGLSPIYLQTDPINIALPQFWVPIVLLVIVGLLTVGSLRKTNVVAFSLLFFVLFLVPSFSNFTKESAVYFFSDRYIYLAQIGLLMLLGTGLEKVLGRWHAHRAVWIVGTPLLIALAWTAHAQSLFWRDSETLYRDALRKNERSVTMHYNLALLEHKRGNRAEALAEYRRALEIDPLSAKVLHNLAIFSRESGDDALSHEYLRRAREADPSSPYPHNTLGSILFDEGKTDEAIAAFRAAIALDDSMAQAHLNLAAALGRKGLYEEGLQEYKRAFELAPQLLEGLPEIRRALEKL